MTDREKRQRVRFVLRLERLASKVGINHFLQEGIDAFLNYQEEIAKLQRDIQAAIIDYKKRARYDKSLRPHLETLRDIRWQSRRLGDALAWMLLLYSRKHIAALADNAPVPIPSTENDGHRGVFALARGMTSPEWGLPIVHDITDVLRIGDITFMRPALDPGDAVFRTFELKTNRTNEETDEDGNTLINLHVMLAATEPFPDMPAHMVPPPEDSEGAPPPAPARRQDRRLQRQLDRMDRATMKRDIPFDSVTQLDGHSHVTIRIDDEQDSHWKELRRAIRQARANGYSFFSIDGFVGYALFYNRDGITREDMKLGNLAADTIASVMHPAIDKRNSLTLSAIPTIEDAPFGTDVLPFFLWNVPRNAINDILRNRLAIMSVYNSGRIEALLEAEGFEVRPGAAAKDSRSFTYVSTLEWPTGEWAEVEAPGPWEDMFVAAHEFRGARAVIQRAIAMRDLTKKISYRDFKGQAKQRNDGDA